LLSFVVLFAALLVGVAAAVTTFLVVGKTEIHQNHYVDRIEDVRNAIR